MTLLFKTPPGAPFQDGERFFLELWHTMTHENSLDSHRVRCLNTRTIIRELYQELTIGRAKPEDLQGICAEALEIIGSDKVASDAFPHHLEAIYPFLRVPPFDPDKKKHESHAEDRQKLKYIAADFSAILERAYFPRLLDGLFQAIQGNNQNEVEVITGSTLSDLVDNGWPLESLFKWIDLFFQKKRAPYDSFNNNLTFMFRVLKLGKQPFRVALKLSGSSKLSGFGELGGVSFSDKLLITHDRSPDQKRFAKSNPSATFVVTTVEASDFLEAAIAAREKFERSLDQLRFNYEPKPLKVDSRCLVERKDNRTKLQEVLHSVPNPSAPLPDSDFREFCDQLDEVLKRESLESESKERIRAAIRQFRQGGDAETYKDKFLNWWMGLEFLASTSEGYIGSTVALNTSNALLQYYLFRLVEDFVKTLKVRKISWSDTMKKLSGKETLDDLDNPSGFNLLESSEIVSEITLLFPENPVAVLRIKRLADIVQDPAKCVKSLHRHYNHLLWHLTRLYRIRCCIVHGSTIRFKLPLVTANMEYYLRELILICLRAFVDNAHISSLNEVYRRAAIARERTDKALRVEGAHPSLTRQAVFGSIVIQERL